MKHSNSRRTLLPLLGALLLMSVSACGSTSTSDGSPSVSISEDAIIIDVRTPDEYDAGHLDGAVLMDLSGGQFEKEFTSLDPSGEYFLYCRSGNRSGQAAKLMTDAGFTTVTNLGSLEEAANATGIDIVE